MMLSCLRQASSFSSHIDDFESRFSKVKVLKDTTQYRNDKYPKSDEWVVPWTVRVIFNMKLIPV